MSNGDKILSENYLQHADHFTRVLNEKENYRREKNLEDKSDESNPNSKEISENNEVSEKNLNENSSTDAKIESPAEVS